MTALLQARDLRLDGDSGRARIAAMTLEVRAGEWHVLLGSNGAGKSSLLRLLSGELAPDAGQLMLHGEPLAHCPPDRLARARAVLAQHQTLAFPFTAEAVVQLGRWRATLRERRAQTAERHALMAELDVLDLAGRPYPQLSGGEQRRVQLARVLFQAGQHATPLLLLDEPLAALDLPHQHTTMAALKRRIAAGGAIVAAMHDLDLATRYATHVHLLREGRALAAGLPTHQLTGELLSVTFGGGLRFTAQTIGSTVHWHSEPA